jgi:hypothetical protein
MRKKQAGAIQPRNACSDLQNWIVPCIVKTEREQFRISWSSMWHLVAS